MTLKVLILLTLITVTIVVAQPIKERIVTFKLVIKELEVKNFSLLVFRVVDRRLVLIVRAVDKNTISLSLSNEYEYVVGAYSKVGNIIYAGYEKVPRGVDEVTIVLRPMLTLTKHLTKVVPMSKKTRETLMPMDIELLIPFLGVVGKLKASNDTIRVPCVPLIIVRKEGAVTYYGVFLPGDKEVKLISAYEKKEEGFILATVKSMGGAPKRFEISTRSVNLLRVIIIITISLLIAYVSYVTARRYVKQRV